MKQQEQLQLQQWLRLYLFSMFMLMFTCMGYVYFYCLAGPAWRGNLGEQSRQVAFMALLGFLVMYCIILDHHGLPFISFELWLGISGHPWLRPLVVIYEHSIVAFRRRNALR